jgi:hypothetical protein
MLKQLVIVLTQSEQGGVLTAHEVSEDKVPASSTVQLNAEDCKLAERLFRDDWQVMLKEVQS